MISDDICDNLIVMAPLDFYKGNNSRPHSGKHSAVSTPPPWPDAQLVELNSDIMCAFETW